MLHLTLGDQLPHGARDVLDWHDRVDAVLVEKVDGLDAEPLERALDRLPDVLGPARDAAVFAGREVDVEAELGGDHDLITDGPQRFADNLLIFERAIDLGGIIGPHFDGIEAGLASLSELRDQPAGSIRITTGAHPAKTILEPALARLLPDYPDIQMEVSVDAGFIDIVSDRFDAGVRLGETVAQDMVAVRIGPDMRMAAVSSPSYFSNRKPPEDPQDLARHNCINLRFPTRGGLHAWEFEKAGRALNVRVEGQLIVNDTALALQAALDGLGIAYLPEDIVLPDIEDRRLERVLVDWCLLFPGYHLYYPSRRQLLKTDRVFGGGSTKP